MILMRPYSKDRLFQAADALLAAMASSEGLSAELEVDVGLPAAAEIMPPQAFTGNELVDAMTMLIRLGLGPSHRAA